MKPYIFLTENYLNFTQDENGNAVDIKTITNAQPPYEVTIFFADRYGNIVNRSIDTLILRNTNIVNMTVSASDGLGNYTPVFELQGNDQETVILKNAKPVNTSSIRLTVPDDTFNPQYINAQIGVYGFLCNLLALTDSSYKIDANEGSYRVVSGAYIHWADYKKWVAKVKMENLPQSQFDALTQQADLGEMTVIPYQDLQADEIYECAVKREYQYELNRKTELFSLELEFNEL